MTADPQRVEPSRSGRRRLLRLDVFGIFAGLLSLALAVLIIGPLGSSFFRAFTDDGALDVTPLRTVLTDSAFHIAVKNTAIIVGISGALALLIGAVFAWLNERTDANFGLASSLLPLVPLLLPDIALATGWVFLGQERSGFINGAIREIFRTDSPTGPININTWPGMIWLYTITLVPFVYLVLAAALRNMNPSFEEASRMSGASAFRTLFRVSLPLVRPALAAAALLVLIIGVSLLSIPRTVGTAARIDVLSVYTVRLTAAVPSRLDEAVAVSAIMVAVIGCAWYVQHRMSSGNHFLTISGKGTSAAIVELGWWKWVARGGMIAYLLSVSVLPLVALAIVSLQPFWTADIHPSLFTLDNYREFFSPTSRPRDALINSLRLAFIAATIAMLAAAIMISWAREKGGLRGKSIEMLTKSPGAVSHLVFGVAILVALGGPPLRLGGTTLILFLAYIIVYAPQASIAAEVARRQVGDELLEASAMLGGSRGRTFRRILFPLMRPGLAAGWALVFVVVIGDLTVSAILSQSANPVVGAEFLNIWDFGTFSQLAALGTIVSAISAIAVMLVLGLSRRRTWKRRRRPIAPRPQTEPAGPGGGSVSVEPSRSPAPVGSVTGRTSAPGA